MPFHSRQNELQRIIPIFQRCTDKIIRDVHVDMLRSRFQNYELICSEVKIYLVSKIRWKEIRHACYTWDTFWKPLDSIVYFPFYLLTVILTLFFLNDCSIKFLPYQSWNIDSIINRRYKAINNFHHFFSISTEVKTLLRFCADVPIKLSKMLTRLLFY